MINPAENVSIDLRSLVGNLSKREDGVLLLTSARRLEETLYAHHRWKRMWNTFFVLACCFAVFVDPLIFYTELSLPYFCLRVIVDFIYIIDIFIPLVVIIRKKCKNIDKSFAAWWRTRSGDQNTVVRPLSKGNQSIKASLHKLLPLVARIFISLPIVEMLFLIYGGIAILIAIPIQYALRIYDIYASLRRRPVMKTGVERWLKPILDFLPFIFASHLYGALWHSFYDKSDEHTSVARKVSQSFWWALRNLSSFGSNLNTSSSPISEIYFSILISISGMALFLVYLNARVQETRENSKEGKVKKKKQLMIPYVDLWLSKNDLSKDLKTVIMDNIHKLENNKVIDVKSILNILPLDDKKQIIYLLCMASLRKVPLLETTNEKVLKGIVEHLKPVTYNEDNYIAQEGKPLGKMLFITQGIAWTYTANGAAGTICDSKWLERGSFCGEEVLHWACKSPFRSGLPISTRTIISQEQVEAFAIRASDLKSVISKFWWYFSMNVTSVSQLEQWEQFAASSILATRRHHHEKTARGPSNWDKFKVN